MAVRMGQEGTVASRAAQPHKGLRTEAQGSWLSPLVLDLGCDAAVGSQLELQKAR